MTVRVRFAPSPTGKVHIGNLRAAIFNWLFARHEGGAFLLRVEDTDRARSTEEAIRVLLEALRWVGLDWDEEPVYQSKRLGEHLAAAKRLEKGGRAFLQPPRVSFWALLEAGGLEGVPGEAAAFLERLRREEESLRSAHREAFEEANARRPKKKQRAYMEPLLFHIPPGDSGKAALHFRLPHPWEESAFLRDSGEVRTLGVDPRWPVLVSARGMEFIPAARVKEGTPLERAVFELEQRSLCGFLGLEILGEGERVLFDLEKEKEGIEAGRVLAVPGARALRFRRRIAAYHDLVKGDLGKPAEGLKNRVLVRSDGTPVFHLANVVDDHDMEITHIVRGDDHVENTYWHVLLFEALGWKPPLYGHLPMIVNDQGRPLSKRDGDVYVGEYKKKGILPEALFNYLALLGWSPGDDREKVDREEMVRLFTLERVISTPARFDMKKLLWLNSLYLREKPASELAELVLPFLEEAGIRLGAGDRPLLEGALELERERIQTLEEFPAAAGFFFSDGVEIRREEKKVRKVLEAPETPGVLEDLRKILSELQDFSAANLEAVLRKYAEEKGLGMGKVSQPLRVAVTGGVVSPPIGETLALLGKEKTLERVEKLLEELGR